MSKIFGFFASISEKRPWLVVIIVAAITLFMAAGLPRVSTELSQEAMMPKHYESVQALDEVNEKFGGLSFETTLLTAEDVTDPEIARMLLELDVDSHAVATFIGHEVHDVGMLPTGIVLKNLAQISVFAKWAGYDEPQLLADQSWAVSHKECAVEVCLPR